MHQESSNINDEDLDIINNLNNKTPQKKYKNVFVLDYIFTGHNRNIVDFFLVPARNFLISSSDEGLLKIYDLEKGVPIYYFYIDAVINHIILFNDNKKNEMLSCFSYEGYKIDLNITRTPFSFSSSTCPYSHVTDCITLLNNNNLVIFCTVDQGKVIQFDKNFQLIAEFFNPDYNGTYVFIRNWKNFFILINEEGIFSLNEMEENTKKIKVLFNIRVSNMPIQNIFMKSDDILIIGSSDTKLYSLDLNKEFEIYWERMKMKQEEKDSIAFNNILKTKKKKPKSSKPSKSGNKKPESAKSKNPESAKSKKPESGISKKPESAVSKKSESATSKKPESGKSKRSESASSKTGKSVKEKENLPKIKKK
jgi:hypothetical protein